MESKVIITPTLPTFGHSTVYVYPTVSPHVVVVPILTCIFGFPVLVMLIICALRYRARRARTTAKKTHMRRDQSMLELTSGPSILASRCSNEKEPRTNFKKKKKALVRFKPMPEIDLDTVVEEKSEFDAEVTATDLLTTPEEFVVPEEDTPTASFRAYRYMGSVQGGCLASKPSPLRSPHLNKQLDNVKEEIICDDDPTNEMDNMRTEQSGEDDRDADSIVSPKTENRVELSSGSSDSDTTAACFSLSPKPVTKSPTAVHLALKKLDGVMNRRHSSPVKVNYGNQRQQRSSGKINYSYTGEDGTLMPKKKIPAIDYIDRELMPDISPRSHSVKTPARKSQSFCSKRRGESFKHKKQTLSRSVSHALSSSHENIKNPDLIEMGECNIKTPLKTPVHCSLSTPVHNSFNPCAIQVVDENKEISCVLDNEQNSGFNKELRSELDPKAPCGAISLTNGSGSDSSTLTTKTPREDSPCPLASPIHPRSWSCSVTRQSENNDLETHSPRKGGGVVGGLRPARKAWPDNLCLSDGTATCPGLPLRSPERLIGSLGVGDRGRASNADKNYANIMNDYSLKYRQDESKYMSHCQTCTINVESDDERSTLV